MLQFPCVFQPRGKMLLYSLCLSEAVLSHSRRSRASLGAHYIARYSLCTCMCKCIGSTFAQNVIGSVDIGADLAPIFGAVQAVPPPNPLSTKDVPLLIVRLVVRDGIKIEKAGFARIAFFPDFHPYSH